jgi:transposase
MITSTMSKPRHEQIGEMIPLLLRHEIQVLLRAGHSQVDTAKRAGVSLSTVRRVIAEAAVTHADDETERRARNVGRPSKASPFVDRVRGWLAEAPELPTQELLRRAMEAGYAGHKSAFYALVAGARAPRSAPVVRFEGLPGEFSQHDFGHVDITFVEATAGSQPRRGCARAPHRDHSP